MWNLVGQGPHHSSLSGARGRHVWGSAGPGIDEGPAYQCCGLAFR